jgi:hypothetical protein
MSGQGGYKHRVKRTKQKWSQSEGKAKADILRARALFESKGQAWDPLNNSAQMAALNHAARRYVAASTTTRL